MENKVLHIGCGHRSLDGVAAEVFEASRYKEVRVDIDASVKPDIVASMTDLSMIESNSVAGIYSSHNLEHLYPHEVPLALKEFHRVMAPSGLLLVTLPDLEQVAKSILEVGLEEALYRPGGLGVAALDILYGFRPAMAHGNLYMAHRTGFTGKTLGMHLVQAGFRHAATQADGAWNLWALASKDRPQPEVFDQVSKSVFRSGKMMTVFVPG